MIAAARRRLQNLAFPIADIGFSTMASIGHVAVGMAAARAFHPGPRSRWLLFASMLFWSALSMLPDADVIGFQFGIRYSDPWGHRGATLRALVALRRPPLLRSVEPHSSGTDWPTILLEYWAVGRAHRSDALQPCRCLRTVAASERGHFTP